MKKNKKYELNAETIINIYYIFLCHFKDILEADNLDIVMPHFVYLFYTNCYDLERLLCEMEKMLT